MNESTPKSHARTMVQSISILLKGSVEVHDLEAAIEDCERLLKTLTEAAESAYTDEGAPKEGWYFK